MSHIEPERLALFAMGEPVATPEDSDHLAECAVCIDDLAALRHAAVAGRASIDIGELEAPPEAVWGRIAEELSLTNASLSPTLGAPAPPAPPAPPASPALRRDAASARPRRRAGRTIWVLAASLALVVTVGLGGWALTQRLAPAEVAEATLIAFPDHPGAEGRAIVEEEPDGSRVVRVSVSGDAAPDTFREVWLITADASALVSLGVLEGAEQTFTIPADIDLDDYVLVDVSEEPVDGDPTHSGDSIVRGELTFV